MQSFRTNQKGFLLRMQECLNLKKALHSEKEPVFFLYYVTVVTRQIQPFQNGKKKKRTFTRNAHFSDIEEEEISECLTSQNERTIQQRIKPIGFLLQLSCEQEGLLSWCCYAHTQIPGQVLAHQMCNSSNLHNYTNSEIIISHINSGAKTRVRCRQPKCTI